MPPRPDLFEELRQQARNLLHAAKAGDPQAIERMRAFSDRMTPAAAQLAIAREHGWVNLPALRHHVEEQHRLRVVAESPTGLADLLTQVQSLLSAAQDGDPQAIERMRALSDQVTLSVAQDAIAREYSSWVSWSAFRDHVEALRRIRKVPKPPVERPSTGMVVDWQERAVAWWTDFPVDADPRPVVLTGSGVRLGDGVGTFKFLDPVFKRAFAFGAIEGPGEVTPDGGARYSELAADSHSRELTLRLDRPLGARVLVGLGGWPVVVLSWTAT